MNKEQTRKFLNFKNEKNSCWLDATLSLVAHNITVKKIVENSPESQILKIIIDYNAAVEIFNKSSDSKKQCKKILLNIQRGTSKYLEEFLKSKHGEPDSAFCALLNLIYEDKSNIKEHLNVSWIWRKVCSCCGTKLSGTCLKPIITLSKVETFHPKRPTSSFTCSCKSEQEMRLIYKELPPCLIFHFENGINTSTNFTANFSFCGREYQLTSIVILEKDRESNLNHFVTWIRNPSLNIWLECNDLNLEIATFTPVKPEFNLKDVYIAVYEAFDSLDRINNDENLTDLEQEVENSTIELIDLSDEETVAKNPESCENPCNSSSQSQNASECNLKFTDKILFDELNVEANLDNSDYQAKAVDKFIKTTEATAEMSNKGNVVRRNSAENKNKTSSNSLFNCKISTVENAEKCNIGGTKSNEEDTDSLHKVAHGSDQNNEEKSLNLNSDHAKGLEQNNNAKKKPSNRNNLSEKERKELRCLIDSQIHKSYAVFFDAVCEKREKNLSDK